MQYTISDYDIDSRRNSTKLEYREHLPNSKEGDKSECVNYGGI
jgi:hypothetical protein